MIRLALLLSVLALFASETSSAAKDTTQKQQIASLKQQIHKSKSTIRWWNNRGRWALAPKRKWCWSFEGERRERVCLRARRSLRTHQQRLGSAIRRLNVIHAEIFQARVASMGSVEAIKYVFGAYAGQALAVARCESGLYTGATNGQYVNIFQMGYHERLRYGWHVAGSPAIVATRAAYRYFVASGRDWSPWSCKPY